VRVRVWRVVEQEKGSAAVVAMALILPANCRRVASERTGEEGERRNDG
jgi:hypothetical protein